MKPSRKNASSVIRKSQPRRTASSVLPDVVVGRLALLGPDGSPASIYPDEAAGGFLPPLRGTRASSRGPPCACVLCRPRPNPASGDRGAAEPGRNEGSIRERRLDAIVDGERIVMTGKKEVVLRCGKASIALTADGKVVVRGAKIISTAEGLHRIRVPPSR